jgi:hypothetical protein
MYECCMTQMLSISILLTKFFLKGCKSSNKLSYFPFQDQIWLFFAFDHKQKMPEYLNIQASSFAQLIIVYFNDAGPLYSGVSVMVKVAFSPSTFSDINLGVAGVYGVQSPPALPFGLPYLAKLVQ